MQIATLRLGILQTNCYVVYNEAGEAAVIDPGGRIGELEDYITDNDLKVEKVLLTHGHADHIAGAMEAARAFSSPVYIHKGDLPWLTGKDDPMARHLGLKEDILADHYLLEGDTLSLAGTTFTVLHTPGHTPGGCCFYAVDEAVLFSGDTLFAASIGRSDLAGGDAQVLQQSLNRLKLLPDETTVYPGHGPSTSIALEKRRNRLW
jgi:glyoxylase-like metal-dependent hydrolase (beta-lactamase superfamily II)